MKPVSILTLGDITGITENNRRVTEGFTSTEELVEIVEEKYHLLKTVRYEIAVDTELIHQHTIIDNKTKVTTLPPFIND
jgi:hypothetical protein